MSDRLAKNRLYIDLIHGKKFNKAQREAVKKAIDSGLQLVELNRIAKERYSKEHIEQFTKFLKDNNYSENKVLFGMFNDYMTDHRVLAQINKGLDDNLLEEEILLYAIPEKYTPEQMNELRLFIKQKEFSQEYFDFIFDPSLSTESMKLVREAEMMSIPLEDINRFDKTSELYPTMIKAICDGILPNEVEMILDVSDQKNVFDAIVKGYSNGLSDDEISACLETEDYTHLLFHLDLMAECHDIGFVSKVLSMDEMQRRNVLDSFKSEQSYFGYLMHIYEANQMPSVDQYAIFLSDCGKIDDHKVLMDNDYLNTFIAKLLDDQKKLEKIRIKSYLLNAVSADHNFISFPDNRDIEQSIKKLLISEYQELISRRKDMEYFLSKINQMDELLENHVGKIRDEDDYLTFYMIDNFEIQLKEFKNYYDLDKVYIHYSESKCCEFDKSQIEQLEKEARKLFLNEKAKIPILENTKKECGFER